MVRKKTTWGRPGDTGVTRDGIPWYVPEGRPGLGERFLYWLFPSPNGDGRDGIMPAGARFLPAKTAAEVHERVMRKYGEGIAKLVNEGEELHGFTEFFFDENIPQPPRIGLAAKIGPNPLKQWWMGGGWDTMAGRLVVQIGSSRYHDYNSSGVHPRGEMLVRTSRRILIIAGNMERQAWTDGEYAPDQIGIRPGWRPGDRTKGENPYRVDIAFADGSWLGAIGSNPRVPGGSSVDAGRDLLAELVGPPVTASVLPALGRG